MATISPTVWTTITQLPDEGGGLIAVDDDIAPGVQQHHLPIHLLDEEALAFSGKWIFEFHAGVTPRLLYLEYGFPAGREECRDQPPANERARRTAGSLILRNGATEAGAAGLESLELPGAERLR